MAVVDPKHLILRQPTYFTTIAKPMPVPFFEIVGILGVVQILTAYFLIQLGKVSTRQLSYQVLNALGAALVLYSLWFRFNLSAFTIELAWLLISVYGIVKVLASRREPDDAAS